MIKCLIVDDEKPAINVMTKFVNDTPYLALGSSTTDVMEIPELIKTHKIDLLFLDIHLPKITGLQFLKLYDGDVKVILTSACTQFALESYEFNNVVDYLVKPVQYDRFLKATEKVLNIVTNEKQKLGSYPIESEQDFIFVKTEHKGKIQKINFADIIYIEGMKNYVTICTNKGERIITYIGIGDLEGSLPMKHFLRVHRSYIIAVKSIEAIDGNEILMKNAPKIPTAGKYKDDFLAVFQKNIVNLKARVA